MKMVNFLKVEKYNIVLVAILLLSKIANFNFAFASSFPHKASGEKLIKWKDQALDEKLKEFGRLEAKEYSYFFPQNSDNRLIAIKFHDVNGSTIFRTLHTPASNCSKKNYSIIDTDIKYAIILFSARLKFLHTRGKVYYDHFVQKAKNQFDLFNIILEEFGIQNDAFSLFRRLFTMVDLFSIIDLYNYYCLSLIHYLDGKNAKLGSIIKSNVEEIQKVEKCSKEEAIINIFNRGFARLTLYMLGTDTKSEERILSFDDLKLKYRFFKNGIQYQNFHLGYEDSTEEANESAKIVREIQTFMINHDKEKGFYEKLEKLKGGLEEDIFLYFFSQGVDNRLININLREKENNIAIIETAYSEAKNDLNKNVGVIDKDLKTAVYFLSALLQMLKKREEEYYNHFLRNLNTQFELFNILLGEFNAKNHGNNHYVIARLFVILDLFSIINSCNQCCMSLIDYLDRKTTPQRWSMEVSITQKEGKNGSKEEAVIKVIDKLFKDSTLIQKKERMNYFPMNFTAELAKRIFAAVNTMNNNYQNVQRNDIEYGEEFLEYIKFINSAYSSLNENTFNALAYISKQKPITGNEMKEILEVEEKLETLYNANNYHAIGA